MMFPSMTEKAKAAMLQFVDIENWEDLFTAQVEKRQGHDRRSPAQQHLWSALSLHGPPTVHH